MATVLPIRLREASEAAGFLVIRVHPDRAFDDAYRHFVRRIAEQIADGLASARAYERERQRAEALAEIDRAKTAFFSNVSHEFRRPSRCCSDRWRKCCRRRASDSILDDTSSSSPCAETRGRTLALRRLG
jgi:hypothetical protein